jgi:hypothetical protein
MMRNSRRRTLKVGDITHDISNLLIQKEDVRGTDLLRRAHLYPSVQSLLLLVDQADAEASTTTPASSSPQHEESSRIVHEEAEEEEHRMIQGKNVNQEHELSKTSSRTRKSSSKKKSKKSRKNRGLAIAPPPRQPSMYSNKIKKQSSNKSDAVERFDEIDPSRIQYRQQPLLNAQEPVVEEEQEVKEHKQFDDWVNVTPELKLPLYNSKAAIRALKKKQIARHECWSCASVLGCMDTAHYVLCPNCRCIMPTATTKKNNQVAGEQQYVGLGFLYNLYNESDSPSTSPNTSLRTKELHNLTTTALPCTARNAAA